MSIARCKRYGVGKLIGGKLYAHISYIRDVVPEDILEQVAELMPEEGLPEAKCFMWDAKNNILRFDSAPDFDTEREPSPKEMVSVNYVTGEVKRSSSEAVWHHKWLWVKDDYAGFDVAESRAWSEHWLKYIRHPSGSKRIWEKELADKEVVDKYLCL